MSEVLRRGDKVMLDEELSAEHIAKIMHLTSLIDLYKTIEGKVLTVQKIELNTHFFINGEKKEGRVLFNESNYGFPLSFFKKIAQ